MKRKNPSGDSIEIVAVDIAFRQTVISAHSLNQFEMIRLEAMRTQNRNVMETCELLLEGEWHAMTLSLLERGWLQWDANNLLTLSPKSIRILSLLEALIWKN